MHNNICCCCHVYRYSVNGGETFRSIAFSRTQVLVQDIITHHDHKQPIFLIYGIPIGKQPWKIFHVNMTAVLGIVNSLDNKN